MGTDRVRLVPRAIPADTHIDVPKPQSRTDETRKSECERPWEATGPYANVCSLVIWTTELTGCLWPRPC